tara:strand:- start:458 stop:625 length:168 start_codon:yes stop_codon:yes gene_type:complete
MEALPPFPTNINLPPDEHTVFNFLAAHSTASEQLSIEPSKRLASVEAVSSDSSWM